MDTAILEIYNRQVSHERIVRQCETGQPATTAYIGFASAEMLWQVLTLRRWELLQVMCGAGPLGLRELARRAGRDVKAVHTDTRVLLSAGVIDRTDSGKLLFPYQHVKLRVDAHSKLDENFDENCDAMEPNTTAQQHATSPNTMQAPTPAHTPPR